MRLLKQVPFVFAMAFLLVPAIFAQRDNPFSVNPETRRSVASVTRLEQRQPVTTSESVASAPAIDATQIYRVGAGDTLFIVLANAPNAAGHYSVRPDGTIDFPLAGDDLEVRGMTSSQIGQMLSSRVKLYRDARVSVKVQEFGSHKINVSGLVECGGERFLQREAMPLYSVKADVGVNRDAKVVVIKRLSGVTEIYALALPHTDDVLVMAGDAIEFEK